MMYNTKHIINRTGRGIKLVTLNQCHMSADVIANVLHAMNISNISFRIGFEGL